MSVQVMVANQTLVTGSEAAEEADQEELTQASDLSSESSKEDDPETGDFEPPDGISFESSYVVLTLMSPLLVGK